MTRSERAALWKARNETVASIIAAVAGEYGLDAATLFASRTRIAPAPEARREVMTRLWERGLSLSEIGRLVGRDHSTVHAAVQKSFGDTYHALSPGSGRTRDAAVTERNMMGEAE